VGEYLLGKRIVDLLVDPVESTTRGIGSNFLVEKTV